jgi:hypothetical protein
MDLIGVLLAVSVVLLAAPLSADYTKAWLIRIIDRLIDRAIKRLPHEQRDRFAEEWKGYVNDTPGDLRKLIVAVGFLFAAKKMADGPRARLWRIAAWPLVVKVLVVTVAVATSQVVLWRFAQDQKSNLELLTGAYLDGLSATVLPALVRRDARGVFDALDRAQDDRYAGFKPRFAIVELPNGTILASSDPRRFPVQSAVPGELRNRFATGDGLVLDPDPGRAWLARTLRTEGYSAGRLFAEVDIADSLRVRREILLTLVLVNGCLTLAFALGGYFVLKRFTRR